MTKTKAKINLQRCMSHREFLFRDYVIYAKIHDFYIMNELKKDIRKANERISKLQRIVL